VARVIDGIDLEGDALRRLLDDIAWPGAQRDQGPGGCIDESVIHRKDDRTLIDGKRDPADGSVAEKFQTCFLREQLEPGIVHRAASI
jgi:hypothetical protein